MNRAKWFLVVAGMGLAFSGCKKEQTAEAPPPEQPKAEAPAQPKAETPAPASAQPAETASAPAAAPKAGFDRALLRAAMLKDKAPDTFQVKFATTRGDFTVTVHRDWAPIGADRFFNLVKHRFYDNASFFRVVPGFVVQFGLSECCMEEGQLAGRSGHAEQQEGLFDVRHRWSQHAHNSGFHQP